MTRNNLSQTTQAVASIAHDLRSPLNTVIGFSRLLLRGIDGPLTDDQVTDLEAIQANGQAMLQMVDDLIDLARAESGRLVLEDDSFSAQPLLARACAIADRSGTNTSCRMNDSLKARPVPVRADLSTTQKALHRAMEAATQLAAGGDISVTSQSKSDFVEIVYECTASQGLAPSTSHTIEAFGPCGDSTDLRLDATSLRLLVARMLIALNGGTLEVNQASPVRLAIIMRLPAQLPSES